LGNFKKFFLILALILLARDAFALNTFKLSKDEKFQILSEKAFKWPKQKKFEAIGNVVITQKPKTIYGDKASVSLDTGAIEIRGNVRYVGPEMTLYGTELKYNFKTKMFSVKNARLETGNFTLLAKKIYRVSEKKIIAEGAEFTTCKDCPKSWTIYGKKVEVEPGEYITLTNGFLTVRGVSFLYIPYLVFPIKKNRETGLLFPNFRWSKLVGAILGQPFFWAIDDNVDMTLEPGVYGRRGFFNELQYRHMFGEKKWFEINSNQIVDKVYRPGKTNFDRSGDTFFRYFLNYEHQFSFGHDFNHHLTVSGMRDLDMVHDFAPYVYPMIEGPEVKIGGYFNFRHKFFDFNLVGDFNRNLLVSDPLDFDDSYVQVLPKFTFSIPPLTIPFLNQDFFPLRNISLGLDADYTIFKQNKRQENKYIRNANRANVKAYADWRLGNLGPIDLRTNLTWDAQFYNFPYELEQSLAKHTFLVQSQLKMEWEKIFGVSYQEVIPPEKIDYKKLSQNKVDKAPKEDLNLIENIPPIQQDVKAKPLIISEKSYKDSHYFLLNHYYTEDTKLSGNKRFQAQIETDLGTFDNIDAIRENEYQINNAAARIVLPIKNTLEVKWINSIIEKSSLGKDPYRDGKNIWDNFEYNKIFQFQVGQGFRFDVDSNNIKDKLTRLEVVMGFDYKWREAKTKTSLSLSEYYFWKEEGHIFTLDYNQSFFEIDFEIGLLVNYNTFIRPANQNIRVHANYRPIDLLKIRAHYDYDFGNMKTNDFLVGTLFTPPNDCWSVDLSYRITQIDRKFGFKFNLNYNDKAFSFSDW
jgi:LPS-assembly protein